MKALTLWPEWAAAIVHLGKPTENRPWAPSEGMRGERFAIHAGAHVGGKPSLRAYSEANAALARTAAAAGIDARLSDRDQELVWQLPGWKNWRVQRIQTRAIVCTVRLVGWDRDDTGDPWEAPDSWHWRLAELRVLSEPVAVRTGVLGLWELPADVARLVAEREVAHVA